jgi:hypothetical protein
LDDLFIHYSDNWPIKEIKDILGIFLETFTAQEIVQLRRTVNQDFLEEDLANLDYLLRLWNTTFRSPQTWVNSSVEQFTINRHTPERADLLNA